MDVDLFDFELPPAAIALRPARPRDSARLLYVDNSVDTSEAHAGLHDQAIRDLPDLLQSGDLLIFNNTRVLPLQLEARRGAARIELTLHQALGQGRWQAFARPARRLRADDHLVIADDFTAIVQAPHTDGQVVLDFGMDDAALMAALETHGTLPLPPYIRKQRAVDAQDRVDYQTILARHDGAVAAPTAGLHFTDNLLARLGQAGVGWAEVTLHVGPGTFLPVSVADTDAHVMHSEWGQVNEATVQQIRATKARGGRVVAVGTTSLRLLESAAKNAIAGDILAPFVGETDIFITPGYEFRVVDLLLTNFHLPRSTLFMLIAAFAGLARMQTAYAHAIQGGYRFYSYGDGCLLELEARRQAA
ncbi:MAG: tRNA preQ1(34) S-adenosylmethionine ribosyltransferase-isomerase QueA [Alphaproteobacteria bacterium]|nr:tRNA preQ1(34) S-adenosylmethionine ribosyltransferase-isomerase QueA [Alphaproteobacteria bacterium]